MSKVTTSKHPQKYPEVQEIKQDLSSLKDHTTQLKDHVTEDGLKHANEIKEAALDQYSEFKASAQKQIKSVEGYVKKKPVQAVAIAFGAGLVASILLGRR